MGLIDRVVRIIIALLVAALYFTGTITGTLGIILMTVAGVFLLTSIFGSCPLYSIFGFSSCPLKQK